MNDVQRTSGRSWSAGCDALTEWALGRGLPWVIGAVCVALLATWVPHYLTWPWFRDLDTFATIAQSWDAGILPYRHVRAYNFPGQTYIFWILGRTVGWGHTAAFYAVDVAFLVMLGAALVAWSVRRLHGPLPGLVAYLAFIAHYLSLDYSQVAQRDWQSACLVVVSLLALEGWPGRAARMSSALLTSCAFAFRPHVALFLPALASAIDDNAEASRPRGPGSQTMRALGEWLLLFSLGVVVAFAPLIAAGVMPDFVRQLSATAYGGAYGHNRAGQVIHALVDELGSGWTPYLLLVGPLLSIAGPPELRRVGRTWGLAMFAVVFYKPFHPVQHSYLLRPLELISSVVVALAVAWIVSFRWLRRPLALLAVAAIVWGVVPKIPRYSSVSDSLLAFRTLVRGEEPVPPPLGSLDWLRPTNGDDSGYRWSDYRDVLSYLRVHTRPQTLVANVLRRFPFPSVNGPTGRLSPFRAESGICWMWTVNEDLDAEFAESLLRATDSVVIWSPNERGVEWRMRLPRVVGVIRRFYQPEARAGRIEVWRRTNGPSTPSPTSSP